eukprot:TRINITY_DN1241_c0_g1_i1.p1 TRINITY_DN1241_c0_g1~~TRINITY_DN1241_c0_g1_i1.p1  ORF type:complete len:369 (-),score=55.07 TRINITY_DN1241_c0_g1_i1:99-1205(-)
MKRAGSELLLQPGEPKPQRNIMSTASPSSPLNHDDFMETVEEYSSHYDEDFHLSGRKRSPPIQNTILPFIVGLITFFVLLIGLFIICFLSPYLPMDACYVPTPIPHDICTCETLHTNIEYTLEGSESDTLIIRSDRLFLQPSNTISSFAFSIVGLLLLASMKWTRQPIGVNPFTSERWLPMSYGLIVVFMGPGSAVIHATMTELGGFLSVFSLTVWFTWIISYNMMRILYLPKYFAVLIYVLIVALFSGLQVSLEDKVGNLTFFILGGLTVLSELVSFVATPWWRDRKKISYLFLFIALLIGGIAVAVYLLSQTGERLCFPNSWIQLHAVWHILLAISTIFVFIYYRKLTPDPDIVLVVRKLMGKEVY